MVKTGFLSDYSLLTKGDGDHEALLRYTNPDADWRSYKKVMIDSVAVWKNKETKDVSPEDLQMLTDFAYGQMHDALSQDYTIVTQPGPGVMRATFAITEAEASDAALDTITSIIPQTRILTGAKGLVVGGQPGFVGTAGMEVKIVDAQNGKLLAMAVDRRGGKVYTKVIADAKAQTLLPIIWDRVVPDSIVYTDYYRSYNALDVSEFKHYRINHSKLFADTHNHINGIENFWNQAKRHFAQI